MKAVGKIFEWMIPKPVTFPDTLTDEWETLFFKYHDVRFLEALRKLSGKIVANIEDGTIPNTRLFEDLLSQFSSEGFTAEESLDRSWLVMGLYASRGPSIAAVIRSLSFTSTPMAAYFHVIFNGAPVLDARGLQGGILYSYPKNLITNIDSGKPYHFWMSAYLSRKATLETGSAFAATQASYLSEIGYQMRSTTNYRDISRPFVDPPEGVGNNKIRFDLAYGAAGAVYGSRSATIPSLETIDVNGTFRELLKRGTPLRPISKEAADERWKGLGIKGYLRWLKIFSPYSGLNFLTK